MKVCPHCGIEKHGFEFNTDKSKKDGLSSWCKVCVQERGKKYREEHKEELSDYNRIYRETHRADLIRYGKEYYNQNRDELCDKGKVRSKYTRASNKERLYSFKSPCVKCGEDRKYVIDFHHIDPSTKVFNISTVGVHYSNVDLGIEVKKCVCLCRNCHTEYHYLYGNKPKSPVESLTEYLGRSPYEV